MGFAYHKCIYNVIKTKVYFHTNRHYSMILSCSHISIVSFHLSVSGQDPV